MLHTLRFFLQNAVYFIILPFLVPVLFIFYMQVALKFKCKIPVPKVNTKFTRFWIHKLSLTSQFYLLDTLWSQNKSKVVVFVVLECRVALGYQRSGTIYITAFKFQAVLMDFLTLECGIVEVVLKRRYISTNQGCVTSQKIEDFIYTAAEVWNAIKTEINSWCWCIC